MTFTHTFSDIISVENLLGAWREFVRGKRKRSDVLIFQLRLMQNILSLHADRALTRLTTFSVSTSFSHTKTCWILKCDIRKFFANIDHAILLNILSNYIPDSDILWLLRQIIVSFNSGTAGKGLPLGNLTSQLFVNIYMNEFDQFVKHTLHEKHYIRYADDFVLFSQNQAHPTSLISRIADFLSTNLKLSLHPDKVFIKTFSSGIDFLGWVHFPDHRILRTAAKQRMLARVNKQNLSSYLGLLKHGNTRKLQQGCIKRAVYISDVANGEGLV